MKHLETKLSRTLICIFFGVGLYWLLQHLDWVGSFVRFLLSIISPLMMGFAIAFVINLPMRSLENKLFPKRKGKKRPRCARGICLLLSILIILGILTGVISLVIPQLVQSINLLGRQFPVWYESVMQWIDEYKEVLPFLGDYLDPSDTSTINWSEIGAQALNILRGGALDGVFDGTFSFVTSVFGGVADFFVSMIFAIYILLEKEKFMRQIRRALRLYFPRRVVCTLGYIKNIVVRNFSKYISGQCTEALILGCLCALGMLVLRIPYAPMVGALVGVTALIPMLGAYIGAIVGAFLIIMVDPIKAIIFLVFLIVLQQLENTLIYPRVVGASIGLPAIWVLAGITVGGSLSGIVGMVFAVPVTSSIYDFLQDNMAYREKKLKKNKKQSSDLACKSEDSSV